VEEAQWAVYTKVSADAFFDELLTRGDYRRMRALIYADAAGECLHAGDSRAALKYYSLSLASWPFAGRRWNAAIRSAVKQVLNTGVGALRRTVSAGES
jgi:hypothetical protein